MNGKYKITSKPINRMNTLYKMRKATFYWLLATVTVVALAMQSAQAQVNKEKKIDKQFSGKHILEVNHAHGDLEVRASNDNSIRVNIRFAIEAKTEEEAQQVLDNFKVDFLESGDKLTINTNLETKNWNTINGISSIEFKNGAKVKGIKNLELFFTLYVPKLDQLSLTNKYDDILIRDDVSAKLSVELNSGVLQAENVNGAVKLEGKYSKMKMKNISGDADLDLYDTDVILGNAQKATITSKYSDVTLSDIDGIKHDSYDDKVKIGVNSGDLDLTTKYSEYAIGGATKATINSYDDVIDLGDIKGALDIKTQYSNFKVGTFTAISIESNDDEFTLGGGENSTMKASSKYSEFTINKLSEINFESSYDDQLNINQVGSFKAISKYSEFTIAKLDKTISMTSENDHLNVNQVGSGFTGATLSGKYTKFEFDLPASLKYQLEANLTYGKIVYPKDDFEYGVHIEKGSSLELKGKLKGATESSPKIVIDNGYDCQVYLK